MPRRRLRRAGTEPAVGDRSRTRRESPSSCSSTALRPRLDTDAHEVSVREDPVRCDGRLNGLQDRNQELADGIVGTKRSPVRVVLLRRDDGKDACAVLVRDQQGAFGVVRRAPAGVRGRDRHVREHARRDRMPASQRGDLDHACDERRPGGSGKQTIRGGRCGLTNRIHRRSSLGDWHASEVPWRERVE